MEFSDICPYCYSKVVLADSKIIYGKSFGFMYICSKFPDCDSYVGVHRGTQVPLGTLANKELRTLRSNSHFCFDIIWKYKKKYLKDNNARTKGYKWLSEQMNLTIQNTHIGYFNIEQCKKVIDICRPIAEKLLKKMLTDKSSDDII